MTKAVLNFSSLLEARITKGVKILTKIRQEQGKVTCLCRHHTQAVSYCFGVALICGGVEIALLDKSMPVPFNGHYSSRKRP